MPGPATVLLPGIGLGPSGGIFFVLPLTESRTNDHILSYLSAPAGAWPLAAVPILGLTMTFFFLNKVSLCSPSQP